MPTKKKTAPAKKVAPKKVVTKAKAPVKTEVKKAATPKMTEKHKKVFDYLKKTTEAALRKYFPETPEVPLSKKGKALAESLKSFQSYAPQLAELLSILTGEKIPAGAVNTRFQFQANGVVMVNTKIDPSGSVKPGELLISTNKGGYAPARGFNSQVSWQADSQYYRIPTDAELAKLVVEHFDNIVNLLGIVVL